MADHRNQPKGCGKCQACKSVDCGSCSQCLSKKKFGGEIEDASIICDRRQCENSDIQMISQVKNFIDLRLLALKGLRNACKKCCHTPALLTYF